MARLPEHVALEPVHLNVRELERSISWYERALGLVLTSNSGAQAELGDGVTTLVVLHEAPDAAAPGDHAGLFHYCVLYPTRAELARALLRLQATDTPVRNVRDRGTHEALYLPDADDITLELAWDRPRAEWPANPYGHAPVAIDPDLILAEIAGEEPTPKANEGLRIGHVHFKVGQIDRAVDFYEKQLGFDLRYHVGPAAFFSVGDYHHQIGANIYAGEGIPPQPRGVIGLRHWVVRLADDGQVQAAAERFADGDVPTESVPGGFEAADPWGIRLQVLS